MVLSLLGKDLGSFLRIFKKFSLKSSTVLAFQLLNTLEQVHNKFILHRDLKPENILMGRGTDNRTVYMVDFGISKYYKDNKGKHIPFRDKKSFIGTTRYAPIAAHLGQELSRKDDLESLGYVIVFFLKGILPWQNLNCSEKDKTKKVGDIKMKTSIEELCKGLPEEFMHYFNYVKSLNFTENPDYQYLKDLIRKIATNSKFELDDMFEWNKDKTDNKANSLIIANKNSKDKFNVSLDEKKGGRELKPKKSSDNLMSSSINNFEKSNELQVLSFLDVPNMDLTDRSKSQMSKISVSSIRIQNKKDNDFNNSHFDVPDDEAKEFSDKNLDVMMAELEKKKVVV